MCFNLIKFVLRLYYTAADVFMRILKSLYFMNKSELS